MQDSWCPLPFSSVTLHADGSASPCCKMLARDSSQNYYNVDVRQALDSEFFVQLQTQFREGRRPEACRKCWNAEGQQIQSLRQAVRERHPWTERAPLEAQPRLHTLDLAFGNLCNLACATCDGHSSHKWHAESKVLQDLPGNPFERWALPLQSHDPQWPSESLSHLRQILFDKTEPFLQPAFEPLLRQLKEQGVLQRLHLVLSTNATYWPKDSVLQLLNEVEALEIQISIDGVGSMAEFLRYPCQWSEVQSVVGRWREWTTRRGRTRWICRMTLSALNLLHEPEVRSWWLNQGGKKLSYGIVHNPWYLSPMVWPAHLRQRWQQTPRAEMVHKSLSQDEQWHPRYSEKTEDQRLDLLRDFVSRMQHSRGIRLADAAPEIAELLDSPTAPI
jgi:hypothetical protein